MPAVRDLLVVGAGGFAREAAEAVHAVNDHEPRFNLLGFLDDNPALHGTVVSGVPVIGPIDLVHDRPGAAVVITTGRPDNYTSRLLLSRRLAIPEDRYATIIHPTATVGRTCSIGAGSVLLAHVDLTCDVVVGRHVAIMPQVVLPHDARVDDFATLASGVRVGGACHVGEGAYVGSGVLLREGTAVGPWAMVGMGSTVLTDIPPERMWHGTPACDQGPAPLPDLFRAAG